jgi:ABC-type dipeptide/oligopeptide/nickel transport system permease component
MLRYVTRRLAIAPVSLLLVSLAVFVILRVTGDPVQLYLDINSTPEVEAQLRAQLHLDQPVLLQFAHFLGDVARGDFGTSLQHSAPAMPLVLQRLRATLQLMALALMIALALGVVAGIVSAVYQDRSVDFLISAVAVAGQSMPSFWLGLLLIQVFALQLGWLPTSGQGSWRHMVLPAVTLASFLLPGFILITRTSVLENFNEPYVVTARSKGLRQSTVLFKHILPNALNPVLTFLGLQAGRLVGGSIITETIFAWPGVGRLMVSSIFQRDAPVVIAAVFLASIAIILANLIVDLLQSAVDPRIRLE